MWKGEGKKKIVWDGTLQAEKFQGDGSELTGISGSAGTADHSLLENLDYASAGHTGFQEAGSYLTEETDPTFQAASGAINDHIASSAIHFTEASIDHTKINNIGTNAHSAIDTHIASSAIHFTQSQITSLGSGCAALDHGTASSAMITNICYGTGDPPTASTTTEGTIYFQYTP